MNCKISLYITGRVAIIFAKDKIDHEANFAECVREPRFAHSAALNKNKSFCVIVRAINYTVLHLLP